MQHGERGATHVVLPHRPVTARATRLCCAIESACIFTKTPARITTVVATGEFVQHAEGAARGYLEQSSVPATPTLTRDSIEVALLINLQIPKFGVGAIVAIKAVKNRQ